jgi:hypothetical protein
MNGSPTALHTPARERPSAFRREAAEGGGRRRGGVWNTAEERREPTKDLEKTSFTIFTIFWLATP